MAIFGALIGLAALTAGISAYTTSANAASQAQAQARAARIQAEAEAAVGESRRRQVLYDAQRKQETLRTREAASGVQIGQGSLLEDEMRFSSDAEYSAQLAQYPHVLATSAHGYESRLFGTQASRIRGQQLPGALLVTGNTLASGYASYARSRASATQPSPTPASSERGDTP